MKVEVNEQAQRFWLAMDEWMPAVGHGIQVGDMHFCAIAHGNTLNITEVSSGHRVTQRELSVMDLFNLSEKADCLLYFRKIGEQLAEYFCKVDVPADHIENMRKIAIDKLGPMPPIGNVDIDELKSR